jgi:MerR family transcriptional regulator, light-induced transcriptional regulator
VTASHVLRIGELSRRSGVSPQLLRAWERRYGLLRPRRSDGGLPLYSADDLARVRAMQQRLARGLAAAEAAALAAGAPPRRVAAAAVDPAAIREELGAGVAALDEPSTQSILDALLAAATLDVVLSQVIVPYLHDLGDQWQRREASIAQEHFATAILRGRMLALARGWGRGFGPAALLACAPGEQHDLALIAFGLALRGRGRRIVYLGADTPIDSLAGAADVADPAFVVLSAVDARRFRPIAAELAWISRRHRVRLAGNGAKRSRFEGIEVLTGAPVEEAERLTALVQT